MKPVAASAWRCVSWERLVRVPWPVMDSAPRVQASLSQERFDATSIQGGAVCVRARNGFVWGAERLVSYRDSQFTVQTSASSKQRQRSHAARSRQIMTQGHAASHGNVFCMNDDYSVSATLSCRLSVFALVWRLPGV